MALCPEPKGPRFWGSRSSCISGALHRQHANVSIGHGGPRSFRRWLQGRLGEPRGLGPPAPLLAPGEPRPQRSRARQGQGDGGQGLGCPCGPSSRSATLRLSGAKGRTSWRLGRQRPLPQALRSSVPSSSSPPPSPSQEEGKPSTPEPETRPGWCREQEGGGGPGHHRASLRGPTCALLTVSLRPSELRSSPAAPRPPTGAPCPHARGRPPAALPEQPLTRRRDGHAARARHGNRALRGGVLQAAVSVCRQSLPELTGLPVTVAVQPLFRAGLCGRPVLGSNPSSARGPGAHTPPPSVSEWRVPVSRLPRRARHPEAGVRGAAWPAPSQRWRVCGAPGRQLPATSWEEASPGRWLAPGASAVGTN